MTKNWTIVIGVDVGGTNTDAAMVLTCPPVSCSTAGSLLNAQLSAWEAKLQESGREREAAALRAQMDGELLEKQKWRLVLAFIKRRTSDDVKEGVTAAIGDLMGDIWTGEDISGVFVGSTIFVNAIVQRKRSLLSRVGVLRLCGNSTVAVPPFCSFPRPLADIVRGHTALVSGGFEIDGHREIAPVVDSEVDDFVDACVSKGVRCMVVAGVCSPINPAQERHAAARILDALRTRHGGEGVDRRYAVTQSHEVAGMSMLERENAAILNACVQPLASHTLASLRASLRELRLESVPLFLTQNDGTVADVATASRLPIRTFSSGPTNSMRGAAWLSGLLDSTEKSAIVLDVGGTTSDVGAIDNGFLRYSGVHAIIGGVETSFQVPDTISIGLGGGSRVAFEGASGVCVGPDSVGNLLREEARCFGGGTTTATDVANAHHRRGGIPPVGTFVGDADLSAAAVDATQTVEAWRRMQALFEELVDRARSTSEPVDVVVVGGGAILLGDSLGGVARRIIRPALGAVANACGAAIAQVAGTVDAVYDLSGVEGRADALARAEEEARQRAITAGAVPETLTLVEREEIPLAYMPLSSARLRIKVVGDLDLGRFSGMEETTPSLDLRPMPTPDDDGDGGDRSDASVHRRVPVMEDMEDGYWVLTADDVDAIAVGAGILGTGGGGNAFRPALAIKNHLESNPGSVLRVRALDTVGEESVILSGGIIGAPVVGVEKVGLLCRSRLYELKNETHFFLFISEDHTRMRCSDTRA